MSFLTRDLLHSGPHDIPPPVQNESESLEMVKDSSVMWIKVASMFIIPFVIFSVTLPLLRFKFIQANSTLMSYSNVVAASILLGFGFLHVLPDAAYESEVCSKNVTVNGGTYPIPFWMALVGFFTMLVVERTIIAKISSFQRVPEETEVDVEEGDCEMVCHCATPGEKSDEKAINQSTESLTKEHEHTENGFHSHGVPIYNNQSTFAPYIMTFGLSFHSIFEGLAISFQTEKTVLVLLLVAISLHKIGEAFALSVSFLKTNVEKKKMFIMLAIFGAVCPIGTAIGLGLTESGLNAGVKDTISSVLNSFCVGCFMYITILGILPEEFGNAKGKHLYFKYLLALSIISLLGCLFFLGA
eukprot:TRINITY_DN1590_c0_g1_i1.p1 TRINITY_DN1590_c0_g1~~TRINITY_DN1590_c0_g1_i1.p1  ORF type:complete len:356 (+),score=60.14 TRINITY_DN1590_c0_g1_i1:362-1429(+)